MHPTKFSGSFELSMSPSLGHSNIAKCKLVGDDRKMGEHWLTRLSFFAWWTSSPQTDCASNALIFHKTPLSFWYFLFANPFHWVTVLVYWAWLLSRTLTLKYAGWGQLLIFAHMKAIFWRCIRQKVQLSINCIASAMIIRRIIYWKDTYKNYKKLKIDWTVGWNTFWIKPMKQFYDVRCQLAVNIVMIAPQI